MMSQSELVERFIKQTPKRNGELEAKASNMFYEGEFLYSWGKHHILAKRFEDGSFLINGDTPTTSTGWHQGALLQHMSGWNDEVRRTENLHDHAIVSFEALDGAFGESNWINYITPKNIIDTSEAEVTSVYADDREGNGKLYTDEWIDNDYQFVEFHRPSQGMLVRWSEPSLDGAGYKTHKDKKYRLGNWHILGGVVLRWAGLQKRHSHYLCSMDEGSYFVSRLPRAVESIDEAFKVLIPDAVKIYEAQGFNYVRQGEWFMPQTNYSDEYMAKLLGFRSKTAFLNATERDQLPIQSTDSNRHVVRQITDKYGQTWVKGKMYHREPRGASEWGSLTGQHQTVRMKGWCPVFKNTERASWSIQGRFD